MKSSSEDIQTDIKLSTLMDQYDVAPKSDLLEARIMAATQQTPQMKAPDGAWSYGRVAAFVLCAGLAGLLTWMTLPLNSGELGSDDVDVWEEAALDLGVSDIYLWVESADTE